MRDVSWLRYTRNGTVQFKSSLHEEEPFNEISFLRKGKKSNALQNFVLTPLYDGPRPISNQKKENLLEIVELLDKDVQRFYRELKVDKITEKDTDPDIDRYFSDQDPE